MLVSTGIRWINLDNVVEVEFGHDSVYDTVLEVTTTATTSNYDDGGDFPNQAHTKVKPYLIRLFGEEAEEFMRQLPSGTLYVRTRGEEHRDAGE